MKNFSFLLLMLTSLFTTNLSADTGFCNWDSWFKYPKVNAHYDYGKAVYVRVDPKSFHDISYMELYVDGRFIRKESKYPFEWCKGTNGDHYLRSLRKGKHHCKVKIVDKCGKVHYKEIYIYVD